MLSVRYTDDYRKPRSTSGLQYISEHVCLVGAYNDTLETDMKKVLLCTAALSVATCANAQSSVTLYGVLDDGLLFNSNAGGHRLLAMESGAQGSERWGLKGTEDLGGGLKAIFLLESGFASRTGAFLQGGDEFGRQSWVGLANQYGTVTLGRRYVVSSDFVGPLSSGQDWAAPGLQYGAHPGDADNLDDTNRVNNDVHVFTNPFHGFSFGADYVFGNQAGAMGKNQIWSLASRYMNGPVVLAVGYLHVNTPNFSFYGDKQNDSTVNANLPGVVTIGYSSAAAQQVVTAGGSYAIGPVTTALVYSNTQFKGLGSVAIANENAAEAAYRGTATLNTGELNLKYQMTPALLFGAAYAYTRDSGPDNHSGAHYSQVNLGAFYSISKRTTLYSLAVHQWASGVNSTGGPAVAAINNVTPSNDHVQTVITAGFEHTF
jgi:predicted porin